jgi:hypothetical protein
MNKRAVLLTLAMLVFAFCAVAVAQPTFDVRVRIAPPAVRVEAPPPSPVPDSYWIAGHWGWEAGQHAWFAGHWVAPRPGEVYVRAHWVREGGEWVFHPGHWAPIVAPRRYVPVVVTQAPPPLRVEVMSAPPGAGYFWIAGHWRWEHNGFVWTGGRWERHRDGRVWVPEHWLHVGAEWHFAGGHWQRL